ncbi:hypothetical protein [Streptomyces sp. DSM 40750]|uniref:hypothetical protein n=1 Tax=Streptomyces sp. DSM 40750 TaxID=2801030 RepID=UPI00214C6A59|nr:hypothetical protein [Streptomyces sp. DSM 40750]UUU25687.1 hypothetical protein JIX55_38575 [Streptomyces sp. DSM 40750]
MNKPAQRTKADRRVPLQANLVPLLTQRGIETYYGVSTWQIDQWRKVGMPDEPFAGQGRRCNLAKCQAWHAGTRRTRGRWRPPRDPRRAPRTAR